MEFQVRVHPWLHSVNEQNWDSYCRYEYGLPRSMLQVPPLCSVTVRFLVVKPCRFPCTPHGVRLERRFPQSNTQCWVGWSSLSSWVLFSTRGNRGSKETSLGGAVLGWEGAMWSTCSWFSYPCNAGCLGLSSAGSKVGILFLAPPPCSRILPMVSCSWLIACCSCEDHLGDITPTFFVCLFV